MEIRESIKSDTKQIENVHKLAFGEQEGSEILKLVNDLFEDITAKPLTSLVATENNKIIGHILFTKVSVGESKRSAQILAPMGVLPEFQGKGVGSSLIREGLKQLKESGAELVFVLGYPKYYSKFGFQLDAKKYGFETPYQIKEKNKDAWMVQELKPGIIGKVKGKIKCADVLNEPEYWLE